MTTPVKRKPGRPKKIKVVEIPKKEFVITVTIEQSMYTGVGETALEALQSVPVPATDFISSGSVLIEHGEKYKEMFFNSMQMKRLLNPFNMPILINDLAFEL